MPPAPDDEGAFLAEGADCVITWKNGGTGPWGIATIALTDGVLRNLGVPIAAAGNYPYVLTIKRPGKPNVVIDPEVEVTDGGPPPNTNTGKKAAKKAAKKSAKKAKRRK